MKRRSIVFSATLDFQIFLGCSVEDLDSTLRMLNETDMAELNFFKVGAYAYDIKNIAYNNFKVKVLEKYFDMLDDKLHVSLTITELL